ncbi:MAG: acyltransferase family protein [Polyangiaceae bacterium]
MRESMRRDLPALTALRFFAATAVVFFHFVRWRFDAHGFFRRFFSCGFLAVGLFFVLSGFILTYAHDGESFALAASRRRFWLHRFARIYPVYVLGMISGAVVASRLCWVRASDFASFGGALRMLALILVMPGLSHKTMFLFNWAAWSLTCETIFYALFPWIIPRFRSMSTRALILLAAVLSAITWIAPAIYSALDPDGLGRALRLGDELVVWGHYLKFFPLFHAHEFVWGIAACTAWMRNRAILSEVSRHAATAVVLACTALACAVAYALVDRAYLFLHSGLLAPIFAVLVAALAEGGGGALRGLALRPIVLLGHASYATYMIHVPLYLWMENDVAGKIGKLATCAIYLGVLPMVSFAIFYGWERPLQRALTEKARVTSSRVCAS